jgi:hypothetical protein
MQHVPSTVGIFVGWLVSWVSACKTCWVPIKAVHMCNTRASMLWLCIVWVLSVLGSEYYNIHGCAVTASLVCLCVLCWTLLFGGWCLLNQPKIGPVAIFMCA